MATQAQIVVEPEATPFGWFDPLVAVGFDQEIQQVSSGGPNPSLPPQILMQPQQSARMVVLMRF